MRPTTSAHRRSPVPLQQALRLVVALVLAVAGALLVVPTAAHAAGSITFGKSAPGTVLFGGEAEFSLTAGNPAGSGVEQYNLSYTDELPVGATYVAGSTSPAGFGEPKVITIVDDTVVPNTTHQVLVWSNVADLTPASSRTLSFRADLDPDVFTVGDTVTNSASAFASSLPREVPEFDAEGEPLAGTEVVSASDTATTTVTAIQLTKSEGSPESELMRGVNDQQTVYTLTVTNNYVDSTGDLVVTDYLPAGLEFLGCPGDFNSTTPEYTDAGNVVADVRRLHRARVGRDGGRPRRLSRRGLHQGHLEPGGPPGLRGGGHPLRRRHPAAGEHHDLVGHAAERGVGPAGRQPRQQHRRLHPRNRERTGAAQLRGGRR